MILGPGGEHRVCLLDDEDTVVPGTMRATGDWVNVRDSQMFYVGRRDRLMKRHGQRVNLDSLQQVRTVSQSLLSSSVQVFSRNFVAALAKNIKVM